MSKTGGGEKRKMRLRSQHKQQRSEDQQVDDKQQDKDPSNGWTPTRDKNKKNRQ